MGFLTKTFGGLSKQYYFRQLFFGLIFFAYLTFMYWQYYQRTEDFSGFLLGMAINLSLLLLYPYARFVYESIVGFILGDNLFAVNALIMLLVKFITMAMCYVLAFFIAPVGLLYLYFYHSKQEKLALEQYQEKQNIIEKD